MQGIAEYYDQFLSKRMSRYRLLGNRRLDLAKHRAKSLIADGDVVADFGCGIGIVSEAMAKAAKNVRVVGIDISSANIAYANNTVKLDNVEFLHVGLTDGCEILNKECPNGFSVITLIDVIEHIDENIRQKLFAELIEISSKNALLFITYPSPEYQTYLKNIKPEELQIIDNIIEPSVLFREAECAGWRLHHFSYVDVWMSNQYIHAVFRRSNDGFPLRRIRRPRWKSAIELAGIALRWPYRVWRYDRHLAQTRN